MCLDCLTKDERGLALELIDQVIEKRQRVPYEGKWLTTVWEAWIKARDAGLEEVERFLETVQENLTQDDLRVILMILGNTMGPTMTEPIQPDLLELFTKSYKKGKAIAVDLLPKISLNLPDGMAIKWLTDHHLYWIGSYYDKNISGAIANTVADGMAQGLGRRQIGPMLEDFFEDYPGVGQKPEAYWRGLAANAMSRSRSFGAIGGLDEAGLREYQWFAMGDERTCDVCAEMDGKTFSVAGAMNQRQQLLNCHDPEMVKTICPWPDLEQIQDRSSTELQASGVGLPPIHFACRCGIIAI